jgi:hypothetical protein
MAATSSVDFASGATGLSRGNALQPAEMETIALAIAEPDGEVRSLGTILNRTEIDT